MNLKRLDSKISSSLLIAGTILISLHGTGDAAAEDAFKAKDRVRFALITKPNDFRRGCIRDICNEGFTQDGFQSSLFDIEGMAHEDCSAETLDKVLGFIDTGR